MTLIDGHPTLNPALKASSIPPSGELVVGGETAEEAAPAPPPTRADWWLGVGTYKLVALPRHGSGFAQKAVTLTCYCDKITGSDSLE